MTLSLGVLCSGSGTNFQAILDAIAEGSLDAKVAVMLCNRPEAQALTRATTAGIPARALPHKGAPSREAYDGQLVTELRAAGVDLVVLAGFMRVVTPVLLDAFPDRVINLHPALLPAFPGVDAQAQACAYGVTVTGCTVHLVDRGVDTGPILAQAVLPVHEEDDPHTLSERLRPLEHSLLVEVLRWFAEGAVQIERAPAGAGEGASRARVRVPGKRRLHGELGGP